MTRGYSLAPSRAAEELGIVDRPAQRDLLTGRVNYGAIYADPPWQFETYSEAGRDRSPDGFVERGALPLLGEPGERSAVNHYPTMPTDEICKLDVGQRESPHCALFMWATFVMLPDAMRVMRAWGFKYVTARVWAKTRKHGFDPSLSLDQNFPFGTGYIARGNPEPLLIGVRGKPAWKAPPRALIIAPRREHSRKPDHLRSEIERQVSGPYLELFARTRAAGWDAWGNETDRFAGAAA